MTLHPDPLAYPPRGLSREEAARYVGVGVTKFDEMVADRRMPRPKQIDARRVWDRLMIDVAFTDLPESGNAIDEALRTRQFADGPVPSRPSRTAFPRKSELAGAALAFAAAAPDVVVYSGTVRGVGPTTLGRLADRGLFTVVVTSGARGIGYRITPAGIEAARSAESG